MQLSVDCVELKQRKSTVLWMSVGPPKPAHAIFPFPQREWDLAMAYDVGLKLGVSKVRLQKFKKMVSGWRVCHTTCPCTLNEIHPCMHTSLSHPL